MICRSRSCVICLRSGEAAPTLDLDLGWCVGERGRRIGMAAARLRDGNAISKLLSFFFCTAGINLRWDKERGFGKQEGSNAQEVLAGILSG
jgi:hypothetical protein